MKRLSMVFSGRVQGVYFRKFVFNRAKDIGLSGFVRNEPDGTVFCEIQGAESDLKIFLKDCKSGPPLSKVSSIKIDELQLKEESGFHIK